MGIREYGRVRAVVRLEQTSDATCRVVMQLDHDGIVVWFSERAVVLADGDPAAMERTAEEAVATLAAHLSRRLAAQSVSSPLPVDARSSLGAPQLPAGIGLNVRALTSRPQRIAEIAGTCLGVIGMIGLILAIPTVLLSEPDQVTRAPPPLELRVSRLHSDHQVAMSALPLVESDSENFDEPGTAPPSRTRSTTRSTSTQRVITYSESRPFRSRQANVRSFAKENSQLKRRNVAATAPTKNASKAASPVFQVQRSEKRLYAALARCGEESIFVRSWCEHRATTEYCDGHWGRLMACPIYAANDIR